MNGNVDLTWATIGELRALLDGGELTAVDLVRHAVERVEAVDRSGPRINAVIELNPEAEELAAALDREQRERGPRGPLHGIPLLLKDNIDTADRMETTAGSLALVGSRSTEDATVARRLREAGAVLLGKANLSEWANFRSTHSSSGWSARGGQTRNPYALDRSPCGSSSGSAVAVAAGLVPASLGTETDGSILCPAGMCGVVGIKPTVGRTSRAGVIPIAHSQDTVGPFARTVADAAIVLAAVSGSDGRDGATAGALPLDLTGALGDGAAGLRGVRIGVPRISYFGYSPHGDAVGERAIDVLRDLGADVVDPADLPSIGELQKSECEQEVLLYEFKADLNAYLSALGPEAPVHSLADVIAFNEEHAEREMPYFGQELLHLAQEKGDLTSETYSEALATNYRLGRTEGIDAVLTEYDLDALMAPTGPPAFLIDLVNGDSHAGGSSGPSAIAGYPAITVPAGYVFGLPLGITFMGRAWSEATLIRLAHAFELATGAWHPPQFRPSAG